MRWLLLAVVLSGCGGAMLPNAPMPGSSCTASSAAECITSATAAYCESGKWVEYSCPMRCSNAQPGRCDWELSSPGDACPVSLENTGFCATAMSMLSCKGGKRVLQQCATACTKMSNGIITCN